MPPMAWITIIPPLLALIIAIWRREVILALIVALFSAECLLNGMNPLVGFAETLERLIFVVGNADNARILMFSLLIGAVLAYIHDSGGVSAFVNWLTAKRLAKSQKQVGFLAAMIGVIIFIESNLGALTSGIVSQSLFDKFKMSRARLAFIVDSTCAPVSVLILLNAWGALLLGLIDNYQLENPVKVLLLTIPLNFYAWIVVFMVFYTALSGRVYGPLKSIENKIVDNSQETLVPPSKVQYMLVPLSIMVFGMILCMWLTGDGDIIRGSGSKSLLWATAAAVLVAYLLLRYEAKFDHHRLINLGFSGMGKLLPMVTVVLLAMALGESLVQLGTGQFVASMLGDFLPISMITPLVFLTATIISFATGTSWGTFGILIPIGMPLAQSFDIPPQLILSAIIGGSVFGDHASPISDSTIISSLASGCDHLDHVKTQLPYALFAALISLILYYFVSLMMI